MNAFQAQIEKLQRQGNKESEIEDIVAEQKMWRKEREEMVFQYEEMKAKYNEMKKLNRRLDEENTNLLLRVEEEQQKQQKLIRINKKEQNKTKEAFIRAQQEQQFLAEQNKAQVNK